MREAFFSTMTAGASGDARLYLTGLQTDGAETVCTFDYYLNGIPSTPLAATARKSASRARPSCR